MESCVYGSPITDDQIELLLEGEGDTLLKTHVRNCAYCRSQFLEEYRFDQALVKVFHRRSCPTPGDLADYALSIPVKGRSQLEKHVSGCNFCQTDIRHFREFLGTGESGSPVITWVQFMIPAAQAANSYIRKNETDEVPLSRPDLIVAGDIKVEFYERTRKGALLKLYGQIRQDSAPDRWSGAQLEIQDDERLLTTVTIDDNLIFLTEVQTPGPVTLRFMASDGTLLILEAVNT
ncbi:MAG TPA: hypothetical protein VHL11_03195 [Phototrophicaceae bacterium]|jgi:hypothetical protein|nr:hypothetical protein [Phototrophicaceae bacterium]